MTHFPISQAGETTPGEKGRVKPRKQDRDIQHTNCPSPKVRSCSTGHEKAARRRMEAKQVLSKERSNSFPDKRAINNVQQNGGSNHHYRDDSVYEAIYPTDENIEKFENQANSLLEIQGSNCRSNSDMSSCSSEGKGAYRRGSASSNATSEGSPAPQFLEFQKIASRLKHTGRKEGSDSPPVVHHVHKSTQKEPARATYSSANAGNEQVTRKEPSYVSRKVSEPTVNQMTCSNIQACTTRGVVEHTPQFPGPPKRPCRKSSLSSNSSKSSKAEEKVGNCSNSRREVSTPPAAPVRTVSMERNQSSKPGFALEAFVPETVTIISADGSREVITSKTNCDEDSSHDDQSSIPSMKGEVDPKVNVPVSESESAKPLPEFSDQTESADVASVSNDVSELVMKEKDPEILTLEEKDIPKGKESIPPFPVILHEDDDIPKSNKRHSGNYKVPIFIKHQDYDNLGTVLADQDYEAMQLNKTYVMQNGQDISTNSVEPGEVQEDQYYLKPTYDRKCDMEYDLVNMQVDGNVREVITEDEYEFISHQPKKPDVITDALQGDILGDKGEPAQGIPREKPKRERSQTHPLFCEAGHMVSEVLSQTPPASRSKQKRTAPKPPHFSKDDTMPRLPPPPPPTDKSQRLSKELQEGIRRYHCSSNFLNDGNPQLKNSELNRATKTQKQFKESDSKTPNSILAKEHDSADSKKLTDKEAEEINRQSKTGDDSKVTKEALSRESKVPTKSALHVSAKKGKSAPMPMISPPRTHLLHQLNLSESPPSQTGHESRQKEKKFLFWKKRKRKDEGGSPEREYNTDIVTQWLEKLDKVASSTQRGSWERMEVINAYKGQETAVIGYKGQTDEPNTNGADIPELGAGKRKAPKPPRDSRSSSGSGSQNSPRSSERKSSNLKESPTSNGSENLKEKPHQSGDDAIKSVDVTDCPVKPPPRTRSQRRRRETVHETPEYVNLAFLKQYKTPPTKPRRRGRGARSLTTGFENLPSSTKRIAPKAPTGTREDGDVICSISTSDPESTAVEGDTKELNVSQTPLKSAMKKKVEGCEETNIVDSDGPPKRPVRLLHTNEGSPENREFGLPKTGYANLEVKQIEFMGSPDKVRGESHPVSPSSGAVTAVAKESQVNVVLDQMQAMQCQTLARFGDLYPLLIAGRGQFENKGLEDFVIHERTLALQDGQTYFFSAELKETSQEYGLIVYLQLNQLDRIFEAAKELETVPQHPNTLSVVHVFRADIPSYLFSNLHFQDEASQSQPSDCPSDQSPAVVVVTSQIPTSSAVQFVEEHKGLDGSLELYEEKVWLMILQVCRGLAHVQKHEPEHSLEGLKLESLLQMGKGSDVWLFNPLVVDTLSYRGTGRRDSVISHLTDKCCEFDLGILIYELLHQPNPFSVRTSLMSRDYSPDDLPLLPEKSSFSSKCMTLIRELLRRRPDDRITADQALWMMYALSFTQDWSLRLDNLETELTASQLKHLIALKQTQKTCLLAEKLALHSGTKVKFSNWEKLEFVFLSEADPCKLQRALKIITDGALI